MHKRVHGPGAFEELVRIYPHGTTPDNSPPDQPPPLRNTVTIGPVHIDKNAGLRSARLDDNPVPPPLVGPAVGQITVANNDFSTGRAIILLGAYKLISFIDFVPGGAVAATALNIAAAISNLPGFSAVAVGPDVQISYEAGPADLITMEVRHYGSIVNFTPLVPATGEMAPGWPRISPPTLT